MGSGKDNRFIGYLEKVISAIFFFLNEIPILPRYRIIIFRVFEKSIFIIEDQW